MMEMQYRIQVKGHLPEGWSEVMEHMEIICEADGNTTISGPIRDQSELYGLISRLQNLGLTLISINQTIPAHSDIP
jgi:hypothetical protein